MQDVPEVVLGQQKQTEGTPSPAAPGQASKTGIHASIKQPKQSSKRSGSSHLTTSNLDDTYPSVSARPLRGPFTTSRQDTPAQSRASLDAPPFHINQQLPQRPDNPRKHSTTLALLAKLNHALTNDEAIPEDGSAQSSVTRRQTSTSLHQANSRGQDGSQQISGSSEPNQSKGWAALRTKLKQGQDKKAVDELSKTLSGQELISELTLGMLPVLMIKMAIMDHDEHGDHRVPVLMNYLKLRIGDSINPLHASQTIFRIELEYGDALMKWVIYREMRDFYNLHAHYRVSNLAGPIDLPTFPKTSLPYYSVLRGQKGLTADAAKAEFARVQRDQLETYLLRLIRAVMFRPEANRLAKFLEVSALALQLAGSGGATGKQGYLVVLKGGASRKKSPGFHPIASKRRHEPKWFMVRDSFIVAVNQPDSTEVWDVFFLDSDFSLERPKRLYRKGLNKVSAPFEHRGGNKGEAQQVAQELEKNSEKAREAQPALQDSTPHQDPSTATGIHDSTDMSSVSAHTFYIRNSERKLKLVAKTERQMEQFIASIERMASKSIWAGPNRFDSFAPIRLNTSAQWLVDGRDYYWRLSEVVSCAKRVIYIHDWWLSPELYLRRPPALNGEWRLDRLLKRKAEEGVKIYVILYKEVGQNFTPVDSLYTKNRLHDLHPNILVQRSPDSEARNLLWSHHEKLCVVDETIAFMGGLDLCFGRWDTPGHTLIDDRDHGYTEIDEAFMANRVEELDLDECQIWPGKDYSNSRASDFYDLNKPEIDMYDRTKIPRQPWHDVGVQLAGQPSRDLSRHFIQRWNYLLRTKNHSRLMPFLLPPPDFKDSELERLNLVGTCEAQICRSAGPWSLGTPKKIEHSIANAYCKAIQLSNAFVYIENQYFITSSVAENVKIENQIGDALVSRIIRAHNENMPWRACIIIPMTPGYAMPLDSPDAGNVRMIMEAQARSIYRGEHSIFARLRREGIDPTDYINFFSLRSWGKFKTGQLTTQDIYIHNKIMVVDDRLVIIGSANINERSQRGDRDSELAVVLRDTDMIDSKMGGFPFKVGRFAHSLRIRLMREHVGLDVDELDRQERAHPQKPSAPPGPPQKWDPESEQTHGQEAVTQETAVRDRYTQDASEAYETLKEGAKGAAQAVAYAVGGGNPKVAGHLGPHSQKHSLGGEGQSNEEPSLEDEVLRRTTGGVSKSQDAHPEEPSNELEEKTQGRWTEDELSSMVGQKQESSVITDEDEKRGERPRLSTTSRFLSPLHLERMYRDDSSGLAPSPSPSTEGTATAETWEQRARRVSAPHTARPQPYTVPIDPPKVDPNGFEDPLDPDFYTNVWMKAAARNTEIFRKVFRCTPDDRCLTWTQFKEWDLWEKRHKKPPRDAPTSQLPDSGIFLPLSHGDGPEENPSPASPEPTSAKRPGKGKVTDEGFTLDELQAMELLLSEVNGNLVIYPTKFLESEALSGNNLFTRDRLAPIMIFN